MNKLMKRILSVVLAIGIVVGLLPSTAVLAVNNADDEQIQWEPFLFFTVTDCVETKDKENSYKVKLDKPGRVYLNFEHPDTGLMYGSYWVVEMYDSEENIILSFSSDRIDFSITTINYYLDVGEYQIRVKRGIYYSREEYTLSVYFEENTGQFEIEQNNTKETATTIFAPGEPITGNLYKNTDVDWFKISFKSPGQVYLNFKHDFFAYLSEHWGIYMYDSSGEEVLKLISNCYDGSIDSDFNYLSAGTYYIKVERLNSYSDKDYTLTVDLEINTGQFEIEQNNTKETATTIRAFEETIKGNLYKSDDVDWYKFVLTSTEQVLFTFEHDWFAWLSSYWHVYMYNSDDKEITSITSNCWDESLASGFVELDAGTYYIKVIRASYNNMTYALTVSSKKTIDTDGDGLPDRWEKSKEWIDLDGDGYYDVPPLALMGADPNVQDVYVECDWMIRPEENFNLKPAHKSLKQVYDAFEREGINLHIDAGPDSVDYVTGKMWSDYPLNPEENGSGGSEIEYLKVLKFENKDISIKTHVDWKKIHSNMQTSRARVFRHCVFGDRLMIQDTGEYPYGFAYGQNFLVAAGHVTSIAMWYDYLNEKIPFSNSKIFNHDKLARNTFMHELGHTLGLVKEKIPQVDTINEEYHSVMSYFWSVRMNPPDYAGENDSVHDDWSYIKKSILKAGKIGSFPSFASEVIFESPIEDEMTTKQIVQDALSQGEINKDALLELVAELKNVEKGNYTDNSWNIYQTQLTNTEVVAKKENAAKDEMSSAIASLLIAYEGLETRPCTLFINAGSGSSGVPTYVTQKSGTKYTLPTPTWDVYTFMGWTLSGGGHLSENTYTFGKSDGVVTARWGIGVSFDKKGGNDGTDKILVEWLDSMPAIKAPKREGYTFDGYYSKPEGSGYKLYDATGSPLFSQMGAIVLSAFNIAGTINFPTLYANWIPIPTYTLFVNNGSGSGNYASGKTVTITANEAPYGKVFDRWTTSDGLNLANANSISTTFTMPNKNVVVTAIYKDAPVNKTDLNTRISQADEIQQGNYTEDSWATFQNALANAYSVAGNANATQEQVDNALNALNSTFNGLKLKQGIFGTNAKWYGAWWHYILFFIGFGFVWMWF